MDRYAALDRSTARFAELLAVVREDQWQLPSPNPGWSVRDLVNHVVGGNQRYIVLLSGAPTAEVEAFRDLDHLGDDPLLAFADTSAAMIEAFHRPGALETTVHHRLGDRSGAELLVMRVIEHTVHGWDLAVAIGVDSQLDPAVAATVLGAFDSDPTMLDRTSFLPVDLPADLDPEHRLLMIAGRRVTRRG
jgi:uncharacterized protein (TIGR03086 family)